MRRFLAFLIALATVIFLTSNAMAQAPAAGTAAPAEISTLRPLGMGITVVGIGLGLGLIGFGAMSGIARQPEQAGTIRVAMLIVGGLVEGAGILALVFCYVSK